MGNREEEQRGKESTIIRVPTTYCWKYIGYRTSNILFCIFRDVAAFERLISISFSLFPPYDFLSGKSGNLGRLQETSIRDWLYAKPSRKAISVNVTIHIYRCTIIVIIIRVIIIIMRLYGSAAISPTIYFRLRG